MSCRPRAGGMARRRRRKRRRRKAAPDHGVGGKGGGVRGRRGLLDADVPSVSQAAVGAELTSPVSPPHPAARL